MATITTRKLDPVTWEPLFGNGVDNFLADIDAVAQIIKQRLALLQGEWWADQSDGLPFWQSIAGYRGAGNNQQTVALLIQNRILETPYVNSITGLQTTYDPTKRAFTFYAVVQTQFGPVAVSNIPQPPSRTLPE